MSNFRCFDSLIDFWNYAEESGEIINSFFLQVLDIHEKQQELAKALEPIDNDPNMQHTFASFMVQITKQCPELTNECGELAAKNPYGFYKKFKTESTATLAMKADANKKPDFASKFTYVNLTSVSEQFWNEFNKLDYSDIYVATNKLAGQVRRYTVIIETVLKMILFKLFGIETVISEGIFRANTYHQEGPGNMMSPHYDMTLATIISQLGCNALKAHVNNKEVNVDFPEGCVLIQFGYLAQLLSKGKFSAMYHLVGEMRPSEISNSEISNMFRMCCINFVSVPDNTELNFYPPGGGTDEQIEKSWSEECKKGNKFATMFDSWDETITVKHGNEMIFNSIA
jgi:hypothetical protein